MLKAVRAIVILAAVLAGCAPPPPPAAVKQIDPAKEAWYGPAVEELSGMVRDAEAAFAKGRKDEAAAILTKCQPKAERLLTASRPPLEAMQAISDADQLYGRMLQGNGHYEWARDFFQKNVTRWSTWKPPTADSERRLAMARSAIAECERQMAR